MTLLLSIALYLLTGVESQCGYDEQHEWLLENDEQWRTEWDEMEAHYNETIEFWEDPDSGFARRIRRLATDSDVTSKYFKGTLEIPVIVHILYNTNIAVDLSKSEYSKLDRIQSQIIRLNMDFLEMNTETISNPTFATKKANYSIAFKLHKVIKTPTTITGFRWDDFKVKAPIDPEHYLNIYVSVYKYDGWWGWTKGMPAKKDSDGIFLNHKLLGDPTFLCIIPSCSWKNTIRSGTSGRTATHEIGHWLYLTHIWGVSGGCGDDDDVADTPTQERSHGHCPNDDPPSSCGSLDMYQNFMDYTNDDCMALFTKGQLIRSASILDKPYGKGRKELVDYQSATEYTQGPFVNDIYFRPSLTKESDVNKICGPGDLLLDHEQGVIFVEGGPTYWIYGCFSTTNNKYVDVITNIWTSLTSDNSAYCTAYIYWYVCYSKGAHTDANNRMTGSQFHTKVSSLNWALFNPK